MSNRSRIIAVGLGAALVATVGYVGIYMPVHSPQAQKRRQEVHDGRIKQAKERMAPGSVWRNMDERIKETRKQ